MSRPTKFIPGPAIRSSQAVIALIEQGQWFYRVGRITNPKTLANMTYSSIKHAAEFGYIRLALPNPERAEK